PENRQQWIVSAYSLAFGCFLLLWGRVADIHGKRLVFILGSAWVTVVTAANAFVPNEIAFDIFRALHGLVRNEPSPSFAWSLSTYTLGVLGCSRQRSDCDWNPRRRIPTRQGQELCL